MSSYLFTSLTLNLNLNYFFWYSLAFLEFFLMAQNQHSNLSSLFATTETESRQCTTSILLPPPSGIPPDGENVNYTYETFLNVPVLTNETTLDANQLVENQNQKTNPLLSPNEIILNIEEDVYDVAFLKEEPVWEYKVTDFENITEPTEDDLRRDMRLPN